MALLRVCVALSVLLTGAACKAQPPEAPPSAPPGPHIGLTAEDLAPVESYAADQPVIGTYLFYWYDVYSRAHLDDPDGTDACTDHPASWDDYSWFSTRWWRQELTDIAAAGIDFAAPVYWGYPGGYDEWSFQGLPNLVRARDYMLSRGEPCPRIALFYDTSSLIANRFHNHVDLSTPGGKDWFYLTIRDFFSCIPPRHWAAIDGRPIVLLYAPDFALKQDAGLFDYVRERFRQDFSTQPYIIAQTNWLGNPDSTCNWGGALGLSLAACAALGPGYDHSAVPGRQPLVKDREDGAFYTRGWETLLRLNPSRRPRLVMVETWNEFHEGTDIAPSTEYGRRYVDLTRAFADRFHARERLPVPGGRFAGAPSVQGLLGADPAEGLRVVNCADGLFTVDRAADPVTVTSRPSEHNARYLYVDLDDGFAFDLDPRPVTVTVRYRDSGCRSFGLEYDSLVPDGSVRDGAFKGAGGVTLTGSGEWKEATFALTDARFANRTNGADLRLVVGPGGELTIAHLSVSLAD